MKPVSRSSILDYVTYGEGRDAYREKIFAIKAPRRIHVGDILTFLFENQETVRYQVQEMVYTEKLVKEADIQREIDTYNELLGVDGALGCTLLIEIPDKEVRPQRLRELRTLCDHLYVLLENGDRVRPTYDERQMDDERLSAVQFLHFKVGGSVPAAIGADHEHLTVEAALTPEQRAALATDLA